MLYITTGIEYIFVHTILFTDMPGKLLEVNYTKVIYGALLMLMIMILLCWFTYVQMRRLGLSKYISPDESVLNTHIHRISYAAWFLIPEILNIVSAMVILGIGIYIALLITELSQYGMKHWWFFPIVCTIGYGLYILRDRRRSRYGAVEIIAGSAAFFHPLSQYRILISRGSFH
jgi:hypothetical protein